MRVHHHIGGAEWEWVAWFWLRATLSHHTESYVTSKTQARVSKNDNSKGLSPWGVGSPMQVLGGIMGVGM